MYKNVMDASALRLDRSELTSAKGKKGTKKKKKRERERESDLVTRPVEGKAEDEC